MRRTEGVGGGQQGGSDIILSQWKKIFFKCKTCVLQNQTNKNLCFIQWD